LAEVLITLVIVGIISAITIPTIVANYQKEALKTGFTKAYSDLNSFAKKFYAEKGISFSEYAAEHNYVENYNMMQNYIKKEYNSNLYSGQDYLQSSNYIYKTLNGKSKAYNVCDDYGFYAGPGGRYYGLNNRPNVGENGPVVCVDTNGDKKPNKFGHDYFVFIFTLDNRAIPMGMDDKNNTELINTTVTSTGGNFFVSGSNYCDKSVNVWSKNLSCAYYALIDKNPNDYSKTYWHDFI
jgi:type II secretory pathway pseudopilin PulG